MPKKSSKKKVRKSSSSNFGRVEVVSGRLTFDTASESKSTSKWFSIEPSWANSGSGPVIVHGSTKLFRMSQLFRWYRFTKLKFRWAGVSPGFLPAGSAVMYGSFCPGEFGATGELPTGLDAMWEMPFQFDPLQMTVNSASGAVGYLPTTMHWQNIPKSLLLSQPVKWFDTYPVLTPLPRTPAIQGYIGVQADKFNHNPDFDAGYLFELEYTCEFRGFYIEPDTTLSAVVPVPRRQLRPKFLNSVPFDGTGPDEPAVLSENGVSEDDEKYIHEDLPVVIRKAPSGVNQRRSTDLALPLLRKGSLPSVLPKL